MIEKLSYRFHGPRRGDVVVLHDPSGGPELLIKRVIGLPGERVTVADGRVYVDGVPLDEPYLAQPTQGSGRSWVVPPLHVFVMGDNAVASRDSRIFGPVALDQIVGHAVFRYWPPQQIGVIQMNNRWSPFFKQLVIIAYIDRGGLAACARAPTDSTADHGLAPGLSGFAAGRLDPPPHRLVAHPGCPDFPDHRGPPALDDPRDDHAMGCQRVHGFGNTLVKVGQALLQVEPEPINITPTLDD